MTEDELREWMHHPVTKEILESAELQALELAMDAIAAIADDPTQSHKAADAAGYQRAIQDIRSKYVPSR